MSAKEAGWRDRAACLGMDPELWFPAPSDELARQQALQVCARCPVIEDCRAEVTRRESGSPRAHVHGIYGGWTAAERQSMRRAKARRARLAAMSGSPAAPCSGGCGRMVRPVEATEAEVPGTVSARKTGICHKCYHLLELVGAA